MRKVLKCILYFHIFISIIGIASFLFFGCNVSPDIEAARQVKIGISDKELKYVMGEPWKVEVEPGKEVWYFTYHSSGYSTGMHVELVNNKVIDFYSY